MNNGPEVRAALRSTLLANHVLPAHVDEVVDLAMHAAERAMHALLDVARVSSSSGVGMCMLGVATGLLRTHLDHLDETQAQVAAEHGHPVRRANVRVGA